MATDATPTSQLNEQLQRAIAEGGKPELSKAFVAFYGETRNVLKDAKNPHLKNEYATLEAVLNEIKPKLAEHKLAIIQMVGGVVDGKQQLTTMVLHESGQSWRFLTEMHVPDGGLDKKTNERRPPGPQQSGIVISYMRRYSLVPLCGLTQTDDDGAGAYVEDSAVGEPDSGGAATGEDIQGLKDSIDAFKAKKAEKSAETLERYKVQFEDRVKASGSEEAVKHFMAKRKELKAAKSE